uniref:Putative helicase n=1 Tax=viral metagenome TaxID=1070528 RepID=A0A6M3KZQ9_9ZZZZ
MNLPGLTLTEDKIIYRFPFDLSVIEKTKEIGMIWSKAQKCWHMPRNMMNEHLFRRQFIPDVSQADQVRDVLLEAIGDYTPHPFLMTHQRNDIKLALTKDRHLFANDTGTGKTFLAIELIKLRNIKTLVVCPLSIIMAAWFEDLDKFRPELTKCNLWQQWKRQKRLYQQALNRHQVCIVNFESFKVQVNYLRNANFEMVIVDESSKIKSPKAAITKELTTFCDNVQYVYLMSGTPAPNNDLEYFSQVRIIDPIIFGKSYYSFRNRYFFNPGYGFKWISQRDMRPKFLSQLSKAMTVIRKEDVLDLPERTFNLRDVLLDPNEKKVYNEMAKTLVAEIENEEITAYNAAVKIMKLRQVTSGFIFNENGVPLTIGKSKLNELLSLLEEIGDKQVLIWTQFQYEASEIVKALAPDQFRAMQVGKFQDVLLKGNGQRPVGLCNGTVPQATKDLQVQMFKDGRIKYMVAHPKSLGHGVTLVNCHYAVYYSLGYSSEEDKQSKDRIYRKGQRNACTYYFLLAPGTIDHVIYRALETKTKMEAAVLEYVKGAYKAKRIWEGIEE